MLTILKIKQCFRLQFSNILQNVRQLKDPNEMVSVILLAITPDMEAVYNPINDAALMAQIGATRSSRVFTDKTIVGSIYELKNAATGTTYKLWWWCKDAQQYCRIEKK